jgi:hypothetical protein
LAPAYAAPVIVRVLMAAINTRRRISALIFDMLMYLKLSNCLDEPGGFENTAPMQPLQQVIVTAVCRGSGFLQRQVTMDRFVTVCDKKPAQPVGAYR